MYRIEPAERSKGLSAEGAGRVSTYLNHNIIHSYTLECNYNSGANYNDVVSIEGKNLTTFPFLSTMDKYTPETYADVGRACVLAWLDLRGHNPAPRIVKTRFRTIDRLRSVVVPEVKFKKEFRAIMEQTKREIKVDSLWRRCVIPSGDLPASNILMLPPSIACTSNGIKHTISSDSYLDSKEKRQSLVLHQVCPIMPETGSAEGSTASSGSKITGRQKNLSMRGYLPGISSTKTRSLSLRTSPRSSNLPTGVAFAIDPIDKNAALFPISI
jgi:hypothetical protein